MIVARDAPNLDVNSPPSSEIRFAGGHGRSSQSDIQMTDELPPDVGLTLSTLLFLPLPIASTFASGFAFIAMSFA
jgi:hypothetical protein